MAKRLLYEHCKAGLRIVHEVGGPGCIVRPTGGLILLRLDALDYDTLAIAPQLWVEAGASDPSTVAFHRFRDNCLVASAAPVQRMQTSDSKELAIHGTVPA